MMIEVKVTPKFMLSQKIHLIKELFGDRYEQTRKRVN